jgi:hypothetical protein
VYVTVTQNNKNTQEDQHKIIGYLQHNFWIFTIKIALTALHQNFTAINTEDV